jgi:hypothetical protein
MIPRTLLLAVCLFWMAYQSQFSPTFFFDMVKASLADMEDGLMIAMKHEVDETGGWHTASVQQ